MTILEQIRVLCKSMGIPVEYAEKILKSFGIEKDDQVKPAVENFKTNIFPLIQEKQTDAQVVIADYEKKYGLKDGKPVKTTVEGKKSDEVDDPEDDYSDLSPALRKFMMANQKQIETLTKGFEKLTQTIDNSGKKDSAKKLFDNAKLPEKWFKRIELDSETSVEDQIKELQEEYKEIRQGVVSEEVESGNYRPYVAQPKDRTEKEWLEIMNQEEGAGESNGVASLGIV